jgi:hypothetical protein
MNNIDFNKNEITTGSGFYKLDTDTNTLFYAPNAVYAPNFTLLKEQYTTYEYPIDGWSWFETRADANVANNIKENLQIDN